MPAVRTLLLTMIMVAVLPLCELYGGIINYTSRAAWEAAGGAPQILVDFNSITSDQSVPFDAGPLTLDASENNDESRVDALPEFFSGTDVNGTTFFLAQLDEINISERVTISFDTPVFSWGADVNPHSDGIGETLLYSTSAGSSQFVLPATNVTEFRGFISDTAFSSVTFRAVSGNTNSGWDNITAHTSLSAIPEPSSLALLATGMLTMLGYGWRRKRKQAA